VAGVTERCPSSLAGTTGSRGGGDRRPGRRLRRCGRSAGIVETGGTPGRAFSATPPPGVGRLGSPLRSYTCHSANRVERVVSWDRTVDQAFEDAEDYSVGLLEFECGAVADFLATISAPAAPYTELFWLIGDDGVAHTLPPEPQDEGYVGTPLPRVSYDEGPGSRKQFRDVSAEGTDLPAEDPFVNEIRHFADCVESGREPISSGRDNLGTMAAIFAIYRSADADGDRVAVEDVLPSS
jgi:predicted dehydrogenase